MSRPGFFNDNENRAYPFVHSGTYAGAALPQAAIVDAGIIMGLYSGFDHGQHSVWLASISRASGLFHFTFATNAPALVSVPLVFTCPDTTGEWLTITAESDPLSPYCNDPPGWEGFLVVGDLAALRAVVANNTTTTFPTTVRALEPARTQSLVKSYVQAISVGNFSRVMALPPVACRSGSVSTERTVVTNRNCMQGALRVKEGFNCRIKQTDRSNELLFAADTASGDTNTTELCAHGGEIALYTDEPHDPVTGFYSGGPACNQVIATINGVGGSNVNLVGGTGVTVATNPQTHTLTISLAATNVGGSCNS